MGSKIIKLALLCLLPLVGFGQLGLRKTDTTIVATIDGQIKTWRTGDYTTKQLRDSLSKVLISGKKVFLDSVKFNNKFVGIGDYIDSVINAPVQPQKPLPTLTIARKIAFDTINFDNRRDLSIIRPKINGSAFASDDVSVEAFGSFNYGHLASYQDRFKFSGTGALQNQFGFLSQPTFNSGTTSNRRGIWIKNPLGTGTLLNNFGIYIDSLTKGTLFNYAFFSEGSAPIRAGGNVKSLGSFIKDGSATKVIRNATEYYNSGTSTGAIVIKHATISAATFLDFKISLFNYTLQQSADIRISVYKTSAIAFSPAIVSYISRNTALPSEQIRVGFDASGNIAIILGDVSTVWNSFNVLNVSEIIVSRTGFNDPSWDTGWSTSLVTSLSGYTSLQSSTPVVFEQMPSVLSVSRGGTGRSTVTPGALQKGNATGALQDALAGSDYVSPSTTIANGFGLEGGGNLSANRTLAVDSLKIITRYRDSLNRNVLKLRDSIKFQYPDSFTFRPFQIYEKEGRYYPSISNKDLIKDKLSRMKPYYMDYVNGSDSNNGLTPSTACKTLNYIINTLGGRLIYVAEGRIKLDGFGDITNAVDDDVFIIGSGTDKTYFLNAQAETLSWSVNSGSTYVAVSASSQNSRVIDFKYVDSLGFPLSLKKKATLLECQSTPGTYYITGTSVYVNLKDGRVPDVDVSVTRVGTTTAYRANAGYIYLADMTFVGGSNGIQLRNVSGQSTLTALLNNVNAIYGGGKTFTGIGAGDGITTAAIGLVWSENCTGYANERDGFNYTTSVTLKYTKVIEVNCQGINNGSDGSSSCNGSSAHGGATVLRVNGKYYGNQGPNVIDVGAGKTLNIGVEAFGSRGFDDSLVNPGSAGNIWADWGDFAIGALTGEGAGKMWLFGCRSKDSRLSFDASPFAQAFVNSTNVRNAAFGRNVVYGIFASNSSVERYAFSALSSYTSKNLINAAPEYADNAAAVAGGLAVGSIYRTGDLLKIVH